MDSFFDGGGHTPRGTGSLGREKSQLNPVTQTPWNVPGIIMGTRKVFMAEVAGEGDKAPAPAVG